MREFEEKELKEIEGLEKLTLDELDQKEKDINNEWEQYHSELGRKLGVIGRVKRAKRIIGIFEKEGFRGVYKYLSNFRENCDRDDIPF